MSDVVITLEPGEHVGTYAFRCHSCGARIDVRWGDRVLCACGLVYAMGVAADAAAAEAARSALREAADRQHFFDCDTGEPCARCDAFTIAADDRSETRDQMVARWDRIAREVER